MQHPALPRRTLLGAGAAALALPSDGGPGRTAAKLELVATFSQPRQVTGVAVSPTGRIFVNFPRWEEDVAMSVAEVAMAGRSPPIRMPTGTPSATLPRPIPPSASSACRASPATRKAICGCSTRRRPG